MTGLRWWLHFGANETGAMRAHRPAAEPTITLRRRCRWLRFGAASLIPPCCVLRFVFHRGDDRQALQRGRRYGRRAEFVPCLVFHGWDDSPGVIAYEVFAEGGN